MVTPHGPHCAFKVSSNANTWRFSAAVNLVSNPGSRIINENEAQLLGLGEGAQLGVDSSIAVPSNSSVNLPRIGRLLDRGGIIGGFLSGAPGALGFP